MNWLKKHERHITFASSLVCFIVAVAWFAQDPSPEPLIAVIEVSIVLIGSVLLAYSSQENDKNLIQRRNRQRLIELVEYLWVKQFLGDNYYKNYRIEIPIEINRMGKMVDPSLYRGQTQSAMHIFNDAAGEFLLVGGIGAGKTTWMAELARDLLVEAKNDEELPVPIILELATWKSNLSMTQWIAKESERKYKIPGHLIINWLQVGSLILLLDGFDEIPDRHQQFFCNLLNKFHDEKNLIKICVSSRDTQFQELKQASFFQNYVHLLPLTKVEISVFFKFFPENRADRLGKAFDSLPDLRKLLASPIALRVIARAINDDPDIVNLKRISNKRLTALIKTHVDELIQRRTEKSDIQAAIVKILSTIAKIIKKREDKTFYFEDVQPGLLSEKNKTSFTNYYFGQLALFILSFLAGTTSALVGGSIVGAFIFYVLGCSFYCSGILSQNRNQNNLLLNRFMIFLLSWGFGWALGYSIAYVPVYAASIKPSGNIFEYIILLLSIFSITVLPVFIFGMLHGAPIALLTHLAIYDHSKEQKIITPEIVNLSKKVLLVVLFIKPEAVLAAAISAIIVYKFFNQTCESYHDDHIEYPEFQKWSLWTAIKITPLAIFVGAFWTVCYGFISYRNFGVTLEQGFIFGAASGVPAALVIFLLIFFLQGIQKQTILASNLVSPLQGIQKTLTMAFRAGGIFAITSFLTIGYSRFYFGLGIKSMVMLQSSMPQETEHFDPSAGRIFIENFDRIMGIYSGMGAFIGLGIFIFLVFGGLSVIRYWVLMYLLEREHLFPKNLKELLDYSEKLGLMLQIGSGYSYIHSLFLDYFAALPDKIRNRSQS